MQRDYAFCCTCLVARHSCQRREPCRWRLSIAPRTYPVVNQAVSIVVADFNGDGLPDVAASSPSAEYFQGTVSVLLNNGHGGLKPATSYPVGSTYVPAGAPQAIAAGDWSPSMRVTIPSPSY